MEGPTSHVYFSQRLRLHYVDWGNDGAPPMLMVHGGRDDYHIVAPDLRGHGDSQWMIGGSYNQIDYVYDIAQLVRQNFDQPVTIVSHSLGGSIALLYAGLYPETVRKLVAIEGLGPPPDIIKQRIEQPIADRLHLWVDDLRRLSGRIPRRYATLEEAYERMQTENPHLTEGQARHLTIHGSNQNEDGTYSWKFDNYVRAFPPTGLDFAQQHELWARIICPTLLIRGTESWASDPNKDGRAKHFRNARVVNIEKAGHWAHHDRLDEFLRITREFLTD
jgi:pimeloyl-ACP methyl ester carboxylesterase